MCTTPLSSDTHTSSHTVSRTVAVERTMQSGWVFLAVDGYTGPAWDSLRAEQARAAHVLVKDHLSTASPVDAAHVACGAVPEVPVVCHPVGGETFVVVTSPTGHVEVYASNGTGAQPHTLRATVDGEVVESLYARLVALLGAPTREESNASA